MSHPTALLTASIVFLVSLASLDADEPAAPATVPIPERPDFDAGDPVAYGRALADYADRYDEGWVDSYNHSRMTLFDAGGDFVERDSVMLILEGEDGDKSIVRFLSPAEIKGVAALTHEHFEAVDDSWLYLPASKRARRVSGANKTASFQGTEFTYEDLSNLIVAKYAWRFLEEADLETDAGKVPVYRLEARPQYEDTSYSRLVVSIHRDTWRRERIDFYDKAGRLLKILTQSDWRLIHDRFWRPHVLEMKNEQTKKRTRIESTQLLLDMRRYKSARTGKPRQSLADELFTSRALEDGR